VATDNEKVSAVAAWHVPANVRELHSFLGLARYYRKYVKHFGIISKALGPKSRGFSTYKKEYMAILLAVQQWRSYL
jgi:hypothetical protein